MYNYIIMKYLCQGILKRYFVDKGYESMTGIELVSTAIESMLLAAALDLGTSWMSSPLIAKEELQKVLGV